MSRCSDRCTPSSCTTKAEERIRHLEKQLEEEALAGYKKRVELSTQINDLQRQLRRALDERDEYRASALRNVDPAFFLVWNANGGTSPRYRHPKHGEAKEEAKRLAALHPDQRFYVLGVCRLRVGPMALRSAALGR